MAKAEEKPIDKMNADEMEAELKRLQVESARLQLEDLRMRVENEKSRRASIQRNHEVQQRSLDDANKEILKQQSVCKHRKGGKNKEGIVKGHDSNFAVIQHTYPWGEVVVMCTRCTKEWRKPKRSENLSAEEYRERMDAYKEALSWPTDNEPSGTQLFLITKNGREVA